MEWYEDLWNKTKDGALEVFSNIGSEIIQGQMTSGGFVQVGQPPQGNQTATQKNNGQTASYNTTVPSPPNAGANISASANGLGFNFGSITSMFSGKNAPFIIVGVALLVGLLIRRK